MRRLSATQLRIFFALQILCLAIFILGTIYEIQDISPRWTSSEGIVVIRVFVAIGLVLGTFLSWSSLRRSLLDAKATERKLKLASSAFMSVMAEHFQQWGLTKAESDVALFSLKGLTVQEIAELRGTSLGTVKAQTNAIYRKSGVSGRPQLLSVFIDDLIQDELPAHMPAGATL